MEKLKFLQDSDLPQPLPSADGCYRFGPFELDTGRHQLLCEGAPVRLQPKSFELLSLFVRNRDRLVTKEYLMQSLWPDTFVEEANLANLIAALRKTLGDSPAQSRYIQTVPKLGYRFLPGAPTLRLVTPDENIPPHAESPIRLIVFPFRGDDPDHLSYAFADDISAALAELNTFVVRSVQLATSFDPVHWNPKDVAENALVDFIVAGTLAVSDQSIRVVLQLIEAQTGTLRLSRSWDLKKNEMAMVRQAVVHVIIQALVRQPSVDPLRIASSETLTHGEAYNAYLMANQLSATRTVENMSLARDLYVECLEKDPQFAPAWARLGRCNHFLRKFRPAQYEEADATLRAFDRAFSLDPNLVLAHALYTPIQADAGEAQGAMLRLSRALKVHPNSPELFSGLVHACRYCGQHQVSIQAHNRAIALDPHVHTSVAHTYFALGDFDRALFWYGNSAGLYLDALVLASQERTAEALAILSTRRHRFHSAPGAMYSLDAYLRGDREAGIAYLREAAESPMYEPEMRFYMARQAAKFEELDLAIALLARSLAGGYSSSVTLQQDTWFASIRHTSEFEGIFRKMQAREEDARLALMRDADLNWVRS
jgi:DNA-binding winged helix-turn-helix (wHTH) protein/tetratricopeptide (TPR) repeat protein